MSKPKVFKTLNGLEIPLPVFFPDATRAVLKTLDSVDIANTKTPGILINTWHLFNQPGKDVIKKQGGVRKFMNWSGGAISDSGGFQVMSLVKGQGLKNPVTDEGVRFLQGKKRIMFTPKMSIDMQLALGADMIVVLDDFTDPKATHDEAKQSVDRTVKWAKECRNIFDKYFDQKKLLPEKRPYMLGVVQGGYYQDLRKECTERLVEIGFDGLGYGGWPMNADGSFDYESPRTIRQNTPDNYLLYGLGVGKPHEIAGLVKMGWHIFDCVLPTRDARHKRLYVYKAKSMDEIELKGEKFYEYYTPDKDKYYRDESPVSLACDCLLCKNYSRSYFRHLWKIEDFTAGRLATIHNLRFYSILMQKLSVNQN